jgi:hypothetical protein
MCTPDAPDMSGANAAAVQQAALSKEQLDWAKQIYAESAPDRANATQRANAVSDLQMESLRKQNALTDDYTNYQRDTFRPLEQGIVKDAIGYDTAQRRETEAAKGLADVQQALATQNASAGREMERAGINPSSGKYQAIMAQNGLAGVAMQAGAANRARTQVETIGAARRADAANLGRGLASNQATSAGIALNQGNSSVSNAMQPGAIQAQGAALMNSGYAGAQNGLAGAAQTYQGIANTQLKANEADNGLFGALGQIGGAAITKWSDVNMKENIKPVDEDAALAAIEQTPVSTYNYKKGTPGAAEDGRQTTTGPMAQDVNKTMGDKAAPKGKKIDLIAMNGITMAAVQSLSKKVNQIAAASGLAVA